jgi:hypothetical protein
MMQYRDVNRGLSGSKTIAYEARMPLARYRLFQLLALILSAAFALGLHVIFGR